MKLAYLFNNFGRVTHSPNELLILLETFIIYLKLLLVSRMEQHFALFPEELKKSPSFNQETFSPKLKLRNNGLWTQDEQLQYIVFIDFFREDLQSKYKRKYNKIFKSMSQFLQTRDAIQCRSHHIKQLRSFRKIRNIVQEAKNRLGETTYVEIYDKTVAQNPIFKSIDPKLIESETLPKTKQTGIQADVNFQNLKPVENLTSLSQESVFNGYPSGLYNFFPILQFPQNWLFYPKAH